MKSRKDNAEASQVLPQFASTPLTSAVSPIRAEDAVLGKPPIHTRLQRESSPTSVVLHPRAHTTKNDRPHTTPRVFMGDEGAEVSLNTPPGQRPALTDKTNIVPPAVTPEDSRRVLRMSSLLDADISPSPDISPSSDAENKEQQRSPLGAQMFCGSGGPGCFTTDDTDACALVNAPQASVERTITLLLSDPSALDGWCHFWQAWFFFGIEHSESHDENTSETKEDMKRVLRNRAYDLNSRSRRIRTLKDDLSPFDVTPQRVSATIPLTKTRSFSGHEHALRKKENILSSSSSDTSLNMSVVSLGSAVWESMPGCGQPDSDSPALIRSTELGSASEDLCYDSDPEEITRRRHPRDADKKDKNDTTFMAFNDTNTRLGRTKKHGANRKSDLAIPRKLEAIFNNDDHAKDAVQVSLALKLTEEDNDFIQVRLMTQSLFSTGIHEREDDSCVAPLRQARRQI